MKYDDASWHSGGDFPSDLPAEAGATHAGMFLAWALLNRLGGEFFTAEAPEAVEELQNRSSTPGGFFLSYCDGKLTDTDLNDLGNEFAAAYFDLQKGQYIRDYEAELQAGLPSLYHVPDTWLTFDALRGTLDQRFTEWRATRG
jgi:hypothetical protein